MLDKKYLLLGLVEVGLIVVMAWVSLVWYQPPVEEQEQPTLEELWAEGLLEPSKYADDVLEENGDVYLTIDGIDLEQGWIGYTWHNASEKKIPSGDSYVLEVAYLGKWYRLPYKPSEIPYVNLLILNEILPGESFSYKVWLDLYAYTGAGEYRLIDYYAINMGYVRNSSKRIVDEHYLVAYFTIE